MWETTWASEFYYLYRKCAMCTLCTVFIMQMFLWTQCFQFPFLFQSFVTDFKKSIFKFKFFLYLLFFSFTSLTSNDILTITTLITKSSFKPMKYVRPKQYYIGNRKFHDFLKIYILFIYLYLFYSCLFQASLLDANQKSKLRHCL